MISKIINLWDNLNNLDYHDYHAYHDYKPFLLNPIERSFESADPWIQADCLIVKELSGQRTGRGADSLKPAGSTERWQRYRDVRAGNPEEVDLVYAMEHQDSITVSHSVDRISENTIPLPSSKYRITIEAKGDNVPPERAAFEIWIDENGKLQCVSSGHY